MPAKKLAYQITQVVLGNNERMMNPTRLTRDRLLEKLGKQPASSLSTPEQVRYFEEQASWFLTNFDG